MDTALSSGVVGARAVLVTVAALAALDAGLAHVDPSPPAPTPPPSAAFDAALEHARVRHGDVACDQFTGNRWLCDGQAWEWVGRYYGRVTHHGTHQWRECIWAHPGRHGKRVAPVEVVVPGLSGRLSGEAAVLDTARDGSRATFVAAGGASSLRAPAKRWTAWTRDDVVEPAVFEVRAPVADWRHVCFLVSSP